MKLWGWWRKDSGNSGRSSEPGVSEGTQQASSDSVLLDDLPPKFEDDVEAAQKVRELSRPSLSRMLKDISFADLQSAPQMPCFRSAMLTGLGMGITAASVMLVARRSASRAVNWAFGGFIVGSVVTWEQCRFRLRRGKQNVREAQDSYRGKGRD